MAHPTRDLEDARDLILAGLVDANKAVVAHGDGIDEGVHLSELLQIRADLAAASQDLMDVRHALDTLCGEVLGPKPMIVPGWGKIARKFRRKRTQYDTDALRFRVADSRLFDADGTMIDETPVDKILHVWHLGVPRKTALEARGIDVDEFCTVEDVPGYDIKIG